MRLGGQGFPLISMPSRRSDLLIRFELEDLPEVLHEDSSIAITSQEDFEDFARKEKEYRMKLSLRNFLSFLKEQKSTFTS